MKTYASAGRSLRTTSQGSILLRYLPSYYGKGLVKIKCINGVPVSEVIEDKCYLLLDTEREYYIKELDKEEHTLCRTFIPPNQTV